MQGRGWSGKLNAREGVGANGTKPLARAACLGAGGGVTAKTTYLQTGRPVYKRDVYTVPYDRFNKWAYLPVYKPAGSFTDRTPHLQTGHPMTAIYYLCTVDNTIIEVLPVL